MRIFVILSLLCSVGVSGCNDKVEPDLTNNMFLTAFPNPFMEIGSISVTNNGMQDAMLKVFDPKGETILNEVVEPGTRTYNFDARNRPAGKYQIFYKVGTNEYTAELIKI